MLLSQKTTIKLNNAESNIIGHMCYAAYKLWNVCNYERRNYKDLSLLVKYPDWYYQKSAHKDGLWCLNSFRRKQHRKYASNWIRPGSLFIP